ncbi:hypothetical protein [Halotia branconii]|uniref:Uncharacterized protein n=1 Tax=Halotia branconii CENA392 TaxID=1539056 RepID=A0AAJ6NTB5_9CYAN|nr:hypothetical protein [Halotia branconii]WGV26094.1 hypothetical protein QI031_00815 [Halotia branconii CENA392]
MESQKIQQINTSENLEQLQDEIAQRESGEKNMDSDFQKSHSVTMLIQDLLNLENEIGQKFRELINNSNFEKLLEKSNLSKQAVIRFECSIELNDIQVDDNRENQTITKFTKTIQNRELQLVGCMTYWDPNCDVDGCSVTICKP